MIVYNSYWCPRCEGHFGDDHKCFNKDNNVDELIQKYLDNRITPDEKDRLLNILVTVFNNIITELKKMKIAGFIFKE